jgi:hypothetical protein
MPTHGSLPQGFGQTARSEVIVWVGLICDPLPTSFRLPSVDLGGKGQQNINLLFLLFVGSTMPTREIYVIMPVPISAQACDPSRFESTVTASLPFLFRAEPPRATSNRFAE